MWVFCLNCVSGGKIVGWKMWVGELLYWSILYLVILFNVSVWFWFDWISLLVWWVFRNEVYWVYKRVIDEVNLVFLFLNYEKIFFFIFFVFFLVNFIVCNSENRVNYWL